MSNMFCDSKISAGTINDSDGSGSFLKHGLKLRVMICQVDGLRYIMIKLGADILNILMFMPLMHR